MDSRVLRGVAINLEFWALMSITQFNPSMLCCCTAVLIISLRYAFGYIQIDRNFLFGSLDDQKVLSSILNALLSRLGFNEVNLFKYDMFTFYFAMRIKINYNIIFTLKHLSKIKF